jgi:uncharacterized protein (TIGR02599 family)
MGRVSPRTRVVSSVGMPFRSARGFSLIEILASLAVLSVVVIAVASLLAMTQSSYTRTIGKLDSFEVARSAFETFTRTVRQATLLSYLGYDDPKAPTEYRLKSDLHFLSGPQDELPLTGTGAANTHAVFFQAPLGVAETEDLQSANLLLTATGFFIGYGDDTMRPAFLDGKIPENRRFRLYQYLQPREQMTVYDHTITTQDGVPFQNEAYKGTAWFAQDVSAGRFCRPLADNVVALAILPITDGQPAARYLWNSRDAGVSYSHHRLPQALKVMMAVIDSKSAARLENGSQPPALYPSSLFTDPSKFDEDVRELERVLGEFRPALNYRIFVAEIPLNAANTNL